MRGFAARPSGRAGSAENEGSAGFAIFAFMWAAAAAIHLASRLKWPYPSVQDAEDVAALLLFATSVAVMMRPSALPRFLLLAALQLVHVWLRMPEAADHWLLHAFVNVVIVAAAGRLLLHFGLGGLTREELYREFAPAARLVAIVCYAFAAIAKHNAHFLSPEGSCATFLAGAVAPWLPFPMPDASWVDWIAIATAVLCETSVPILLLIPRLRLWGIGVGVLFHFAVSHTPDVLVFDFTSVLLALWFLFLPKGFVGRLRARWRRDRPTLGPPLRWAARLLPAVGLALLGVWLLGDDRTGRLLHWGLRQTAFLLYGCVVLGLLLAGLRERSVPLEPLRRLFRPLHALYVPLLVVVVLNGLSPYLGWKTQATFSMFSNLRTERGQWNHLYIPRGLRSDRFQNDFVPASASSDFYLQRKYVDEALLVPRFELQRRVASDPELTLTVSEAGGESVVRPARLDPQLATAPPYLLRKLFLFRGVPEDGSPWCGN